MFLFPQLMYQCNFYLQEKIRLTLTKLMICEAKNFKVHLTTSNRLPVTFFEKLPYFDLVKVRFLDSTLENC